MMAITGKNSDVLAGELALGVLEGEERSEALRRLLSDRAFAEQVERWRHNFGGLYDDIPAAQPPESVWAAIANGVSGQDNESAAPAKQPTKAPSLWKASAIGSGLVAILLFGIIISGPISSPLLQQEQLAQQSPGQNRQSNDQGFAIARLDSPIDGLDIAARFDGENNILRVKVVGMPETQTEPAFWLVAANGNIQPLGYLARDGETVLTIKKAVQPLITEGAILSLSMEEPAESLPQKPQNDFVAQGKITII